LLQAVLNFVNNGGGLAVMLHIPQPTLNLLRQFDVDVANGTLHEEGVAIDGNPFISRLANLRFIH